MLYIKPTLSGGPSDVVKGEQEPAIPCRHMGKRTKACTRRVRAKKHSVDHNSGIRRQFLQPVARTCMRWMATPLLLGECMATGGWSQCLEHRFILGTPWELRVEMSTVRHKRTKLLFEPPQLHPKPTKKSWTKTLKFFRLAWPRDQKTGPADRWPWAATGNTHFSLLSFARHLLSINAQRDTFFLRISLCNFCP